MSIVESQNFTFQMIKVRERKCLPSAKIGIRPMYFMIEPKIIEQMALTTPKQIIT